MCSHCPCKKIRVVLNAAVNLEANTEAVRKKKRESKSEKNLCFLVEAPGDLFLTNT